MNGSNQQPHVVLVPSPGMGHLTPLVEFAKLLHFRHHFSTTILLPTTTTPPSSATTTLLSTLPSDISYTFLPPVDPTLLPRNAPHEVTIHLVHYHSLPHVRSTVSSLSNVVAVVTDLFGTDYFDVARELGIPPYMYFTSNAFCLLFLFRLPKLDETVSCPFQDMDDPLVLPGCVPLHGKDFEEPTLDRNSESYKLELYHAKRYNLCEGIFINTFYDLEPSALHALQHNESNLTAIYPIGPMIRSDSGDGGDNATTIECLGWLDRQPPGSVLYVSFGSGGTLSLEQINELAIGLEKSEQRFLWVVRSPNDETSCGSFFNAQIQHDSFGFLPRGYLDRIKDRGLLVPFWAPQIKILAHGSIGGFLSHCGWNSILESIVNGVPLIAWPLYAEQGMNALMLDEGLKVALCPKKNGRDLVESNEIVKVVNELMDGELGKKAQRRMKDISDAATKARSEDGENNKVLSQVALGWYQNTN